MKLTKSQVEAIVDEVNDRINQATQNQINLFRGKSEWDKIQLSIKGYQEIEDKLEKSRAEVEKIEVEYEEYEESLRKKIAKFEEKYQTEVDWRYLESGEAPSFRMKFKDLKEKIERSVTLLSIDTKEKITSDVLIEKMVDKFSEV